MCNITLEPFFIYDLRNGSSCIFEYKKNINYTFIFLQIVVTYTCIQIYLSIEREGGGGGTCFPSKKKKKKENNRFLAHFSWFIFLCWQNQIINTHVNSSDLKTDIFCFSFVFVLSVFLCIFTFIFFSFLLEQFPILEEKIHSSFLKFKLFTSLGHQRSNQISFSF